jgi:hypothetical protein
MSGAIRLLRVSGPKCQNLDQNIFIGFSSRSVVQLIEKIGTTVDISIVLVTDKETLEIWLTSLMETA